MRTVDTSALSAFTRKTAELGSDFASVVRDLIKDVRDSYRRDLPGPKWRARCLRDK